MAKALTRVILITGARSGIGAALARRLAAPGVGLMLHTRSTENGHLGHLEQVATQAREAGAKVLTGIVDLAVKDAGERLVAATVAQFGRLDHLVSNAGFAHRGGFGDVDRSALDVSHRAMTGAFFDLATAALPDLQQSPQGRVVAVSSFVAHRFDPQSPFPVSSAAKAGLEALVRSLAAQLAASGVTVNAVVPGYTRKDRVGHSALSEDAWQRAAELTPLGKIAEPDDVAALIAFLLSPDARHITGQAIHVDGGLSLL